MVSKEEFNEYLEQLIEKEMSQKDLWLLSDRAIIANWLIHVFGLIAIVSSLGLLLGSLWLIALILLMIGIFVMIIGVVFSNKIRETEKKCVKIYKERVIKFLLTGYDYSLLEKEYIDKEIFIDSQFINYKSYSYYKGEDLLNINIRKKDGNISLKLCDLSAVASRNKDKEDKYKGIFGYIEFPFDFNCILIVNSYYNYRGINVEKVQLEDIYFNSKFNVRASNQTEVRHILTPLLLENLLKLDETGKRIKLAIIDNKIYIGLFNGKLFQTKKIKDNKLISIFEDYYDPIYSILSIMDEIKNNKAVNN